MQKERKLLELELVGQAFKAGHKLVIGTQEDGILFLGLGWLQGAAEEARGRRNWPSCLKS